MTEGRRGYFVLAALVLVADQISKWLVHARLSDRGPVEIIPNFFSLWYSRNSGGLFGYFREWNPTVKLILLTGLPVLAVGFIAYLIARGHESDRGTLGGLGLILGGATGNLVDRIFRGSVIDFLDVYVAPSRLADWLIARFGTAHWPTFNLADSAIVVGACLLVLQIFRPQPSSDAHASADGSV